MSISLLPKDFYLSTDVIGIAKELLGKILISYIDRKLTAGIIVETEAYMAPADKASHAYNNKKTQRTITMFQAGGIAYVYLCYGMHNLFNVVTGPKHTPHAILIRALEPCVGLDIMQNRLQNSKKLTKGPALLTKALNITTKHNGIQLVKKQIWIEHHITPNKIIATTRIGVNYAKEYALKPWRFYIADNPWISVK